VPSHCPHGFHPVPLQTGHSFLGAVFMFWEPSNRDAATRATPRRANAREDDDAREDDVVVEAVAGGRTNMTRARVRDNTWNRMGTPTA